MSTFELRYGTLLNRFRVELVELCGGKAGAGRCDCRGGGGCRVVLAGDGTRSRQQRYDTLLTVSKFWSELNMENHDIMTILLV